MLFRSKLKAQKDFDEVYVKLQDVNQALENSHKSLLEAGEALKQSEHHSRAHCQKLREKAVQDSADIVKKANEEKAEILAQVSEAKIELSEVKLEVEQEKNNLLAVKKEIEDVKAKIAQFMRA